MSDTKISEAAVEAALDAPAGTWQVRDMLGCDESEHAEVMRVAITAALSHLHPQPAELVEQQGADSRDIAMKVRADLDRQSCPDAYMCIAVESVMKHLAATGKQQVGEKCLTCSGRGWVGGPTYSDPAEGGMQCPDCNALDAHMERYEQQVGEVQGD